VLGYNEGMKKFVYLVLFTVLGFLTQLLLHAIIEQWYIGLLIADFGFYGFGLSWDNWFTIHSTLTIVFSLLGVMFGFKCGQHAWRILYDEKGKLRPEVIAKWRLYKPKI